MPGPQPFRFTPLQPWQTRWPSFLGEQARRSLDGTSDGCAFTAGALSWTQRCDIARHQFPGTGSDSRVTRLSPCARRTVDGAVPPLKTAQPTSPITSTGLHTATSFTSDMMDTSRGSFYDHDIPSLTSSLEAFDPERSMHSAYSGRSNMHSSRWSVPQEEMDSEAESDGPWAPPAWQKSNNQWMRKSHLSRETTPSRIPLPESPLKQTPRTSPEPMSEQEQSFMPGNIASRMQSWSEERQAGMGAQQGDEMALSHHDEAGQHEGCRFTWARRACPALIELVVRFAIRGETQFRTAPIEDSLSSFTSGVHYFTRSRVHLVGTITTIVIAWLLLQPWTATLIPDIANVAGMAKQFEPLLYASENVIPRSRELSDAGIAVEDLGMSVRASNMSASTTIVDQLDDLGDSLKMLSTKITSFFSDVDSDMDK